MNAVELKSLYLTNPAVNLRFKIPGISASIMDLLIEYSYVGSIDINYNSVSDLLPAADQFDILGLLRDCCCYLKSNMLPENVIGIRNFARAYFCRNLVNQCEEYIMQNFVKITQNSCEILELPLEEIISIFGS